MFFFNIGKTLYDTSDITYPHTLARKNKYLIANCCSSTTYEKKVLTMQLSKFYLKIKHDWVFSLQFIYLIYLHGQLWLFMYL